MNLYRELTSSCDLCLSSGFPAPRRKISLTHVNEAFNSELQAEFTFPYYQGSKMIILNIIATGTAYGERILVPNTSAQSIIAAFEQFWLYRHGAPKYFGADQEFNSAAFDTFLRTHSIQFFPRPARSSHKSGRVERNNAVFKLVFDRISRELTSASLPALIHRASFLTNMFHGNATLSSFQLARGYSPSVIGIPSTIVPQSLLDAHIEISATRALQTLLRSKSSSPLQHHQLAPGMRV